ncbi:MAG: RidA family protein [Lachnospiraceae bacterium]
MKREEIAAGLGIELGEAQDISSDVAAFRKAGKLIFTSGLVPHEPDGSIALRKSGPGLYHTAGPGIRVRDVAAQLLCALKTAAGDLDNIGQIVMLQCFANAVSDYSEQSVLFNPASELFTAVFGESGKHARFALGMGSLPMNVPVEISVIAEMK